MSLQKGGNMYRRQGELEIVEVNEIKGKKLKHCIIAEGEVTGHKHEITSGEAELYEDKGVLYLSVKSSEAILIHPDHDTVTLPKGNYRIDIQREYVVGDDKYRKVMD